MTTTSGRDERGQRQIKILIAEDNETARRTLENLLHRFFPDKRLVIFATGSIKTAQQFAHVRGPFALGLIDLELEDSKPDETAAVVPRLRCAAVIAMSGVASGEARRQVRRCGDTVDYIEKPIIEEVFIDKVARALGRHDKEGSDFADVQIRAQKRLQERVVAPSGSVISNVASAWAKVGLPALAALSVVLSFAGGNMFGAYNAAVQKGREEQRLADKLQTFESNISEIKNGQQAGVFERAIMQRNILKLCWKLGVDPERN